MINIYAPGATDWASNGLAILLPTECKISETAGGSYELEMTHPITDDLRWKTIAKGCVIKAPVPAAETPAINLVKAGIPGVPATPGTPEIPAVPGVPGRVIWKVNITTIGANGRSRIYEKPSTDSRKLAYLPNGAEYEYLGAHNGSWHRAVNYAGISGYMWTANSVYVRTEAETGGIPAVPATPEIPAIPAVPGYSTVVGPRQIRTQLFRVYHVEKDPQNHAVKVWARHISYDLMGNMCGNLTLNNVPMPIALTTLKSSLINPDDRELMTNIPTAISGEWQYENGIKVLLDPETGFVAKSRCKIIRDNNDIFLLDNIAYDRRVRVEYGKNLNGIKWTERSDTIVTRIVPVGRNADNTNLLLPETYVDSQFISIYPVVYTQKLDVPDAKVSDTMTAEQAYTAMRNAAAAEYAKGCDLITFDLDVDFIQLGDTEEYKQYHDLQHVFLYDTITINHSPTGFSARAQVKAYEWDAIQNRYTKVTLGDVFEVAGSTIAGYQLPTGGISGTKLMPGGVGNDQLRDLSVLSAKIGLAQIDTAHIKLAAIDTANIRDLAVTDAKIENLTADKLTAGTIDAELIDVVNLNADNIVTGTLDASKATIINLDAENITTGKITADQMETGTITAASGIIGDAAIDTAQIKDASITDAKIDSAGINYGNISDLVAGTAIFREGIGGKLIIDRLSVSEANIVNLTTGTLIVQGADGALYELSVDIDGNIITILRQIGNDDIEDLSLDAGEKLVKSSITADLLDVQQIFASSALIGAIKADNIAAHSVNVSNINPAALSEIKSNSLGQQMFVEFSNGTILDKENTQTIASIRITHQGVDVTDLIPSEAVSWERISENAEGDVVFNANNASKKQITISAADIDFKGTIRCKIIGTSYTPAGSATEIIVGSMFVDTQMSNLKTSYVSMGRGQIEIYSGGSFNLRAGSGETAIGISNDDAMGYVQWAGGDTPQSSPYWLNNRGEMGVRKLTIADRADFVQNGAVVAYFKDNQLWVKEGIFGDSISIGNWKFNADSGLTIKWGG